MSIIKCCLCGKDFESWGSHNPYPLGNDNERCCDECMSDKVRPARKLWVEEGKEIEIELTVTLRGNLIYKLEQIRDNANREVISDLGEDVEPFTLEEVASDLLDEAIIERMREL